MRPRAAAGALLFPVLAALVASTAGVLPAGAQQRTVQAVPGMSYLIDIWCGADGVCLGVGIAPGNVGAVVVLRANGQSGPVRTVPGTQTLTAIDCPAVGSCIAVAQGGFVVEVSRDGTPGPARGAPGTGGLWHVACPTPTTCLATGALYTWTLAGSDTSAVFTVITNGQPAPAQGFPRGTSHAHGIDCPTATTCLVTVTDAIVVLRDTGGTWLSTLRWIPAGSGGHLQHDISCGSSTTCYATATSSVQTPEGSIGVPAMMPVTADGVAGPVQVLTNQRGLSQTISCVLRRTCTVVGQKHNAPAADPQGLSIDVSRGSPEPAIIWPEVGDFVAVSCVAPATCGLLGYGPYFAWHGPIPA